MANHDPNDRPTPPAPGASPALDGAAAIVGLVERLATAQGRDDLAGELGELRASLAVAPVEVLIVGGPGQGKSSLVNALVGAPVCAVGAGGVTTATTTVRWGDEYGATIWREPAGTGPAQPEVTPYGQAVGLTTASANPANRWRLRDVELRVPSPLLERGLTLIDTPPVQQLWSPSVSRVISAMGRVAAVVLVTSAGAPLTAGELDLARLAAAACPRVIVAVNGTGTYPAWAAIVEQDELLLERRGVPAEVVALDAAPYWNDRGGLAPGPDPGMGRLATSLVTGAVLDREQSRISSAVTEAFWAADRLRLRLWAEHALLGDDDAIGSAAATVAGAAEHAATLAAPGAAWLTQLHDAAGQLRRDLRWDLEAEHRKLVELAITLPTVPDDPSRAVFHRRLADAIAHLQRMRKLSLRALAKAVAETMREEAATLSGALPQMPDAHALGLPRLDRLPAPPAGALRTLPLRERPTTSGGAGSIAPELHAWLDVAFDLVQRENDDGLDATVADLERRCSGRARELHRSLVEVHAAVLAVHGADPQHVWARRQVLDTELEQLATVEFQLDRR